MCRHASNSPRRSQSPNPGNSRHPAFSYGETGNRLYTKDPCSVVTSAILRVGNVDFTAEAQGW